MAFELTAPRATAAGLAVLACLSLTPVSARAAALREGDDRIQAAAAIRLCLARNDPGSTCAGEAEAACLKRARSDSGAAQEGCAIAERDAWADLLPAAFATALGRLDDAKAAAQLRAAQQLWRRWRGAEVSVVFKLSAGGTIQDTATARRFSQITAARVRELQQYDTVLDAP